MSQAVFIQDYGVWLPTGDSARGLLCATLAGVPAVNVEKTLALAVGDDTRAHNPCLAVLPEEMDLQEQLEERLEALAESCEQILVTLPDVEQERHRRLLALLESLSLSDKIKDRLLIHRQGACYGPFADLLAALRSGDVASFALLGVDSLVHPTTLQHYAAAGTLRTDKLADGVALGEGMAWCRFTREAGPYRWQNESRGTEPNHAAITPIALAGLADTLAYLVPEAPLPRPSLIVHSRAQTPKDDLEWHHARQRLWPQRLAPRVNLAMRKGELDAPQPEPQPYQQQLKPALQVGELGAAALPAAIALACERLGWPLQPAEQALVVDRGDNGERFAALIDHCREAQEGSVRQKQNKSAQRTGSEQ